MYAVTPDLAARVAGALSADWPAVEVVRLTELTGGASSLTYSAELRNGPASRVVVKMAPPGLAPIRNRDVLRQASILRRLGGSEDVRVPRVHGSDGGTPPAVPPLFVMSFEPGDSAEPLHVAARIEPAVVRSRALHAARMLAALHRVDVADLADDAVPIREEVLRWDRALATVPPDIVPQTHDICALLLERLPASGPPALLHGDWRLGNSLCVGGEIRSVIDWEISSIGDPRADLAWFLMMCDPAHPCAIAGPETGMPPVDELVAEYEPHPGRPVEDLRWFRCLTVFKQVATTALIAKNCAKRGVPMEQVTARMSRMLPELLGWAATFLPDDTMTDLPSRRSS